MRATVQKWGNSAAVRIPASLMNAVALKAKDAVDVREENGCIVIEPVRKTEYDLKEMVAKITPKNLHGEVSFGPAMGKEAF